MTTPPPHPPPQSVMPVRRELYELCEPGQVLVAHVDPPAVPELREAKAVQPSA